MTRQYVGQNELGPALHSALRKACDSKPTTAAYIMILLMPQGLWREYLTVVGNYFGAACAENKLTESNVAEHLKYASLGEGFGTRKEQRMRGFEPAQAGTLAYDNVHRTFFMAERDLDRTPGALRKFIYSLPEKETAGRTDEEILRERDRLRSLFAAILGTFDEDDWNGMAAYTFTTNVS